MTHPVSQDARASASIHLMSAQLWLVDDPDAEDVVAALSVLRADLAAPRLRLLPGGRDADNRP